MAEDRLQKIPQSEERKAPAVRPAVADLQRRFEKIAQRDADLVEAMNRFADITPEELREIMDLIAAGDRKGLKAKGWTLKAAQTAILARQPRATVPFAMLAAHERTGMRIRRMQPKASSAKINVNVINISARAPRKRDDEVKIVEEKK